MSEAEIEKIADVVVCAYCRCAAGTSSAFCRMFNLIAALISDLSPDGAFTMTARIFSREHRAFEREFEHVNARHTGRFQITFRPELN